MEITITIKADKEELPALKGQNEPKEATQFDEKEFFQSLSSLLRRAIRGLQPVSADSASTHG